VPDGGWREFAAFAGPELPQLTAWDGRVVLVGDSSHALSGAFGSGAGFAMEDGWVLAQALVHARNDRLAALALFDELRVPYYARMYAHLAAQADERAHRLRELADAQPTYDQGVANKIISDGGKDMSWIYENDIGKVWKERVAPVGPSAVPVLS
jgi:salicylate hydroxylase